MASPTRGRLVDAASRLFATLGYEATSLAQVCRVAGANPGSLYHFFPSKADLLAATLEAHSAWLDGHLAEIAARTTDPVQRVFALLDAYRERLLRTSFTDGCPVGRVALELGDLPDPVRAAVDAHLDRWADAVRGFLAPSRGALPPVVDLGELSTFVLTTMEGAVLQARARRSIEPFDLSVGQLWDYLEFLAQGIDGEGSARGMGRDG